MEPIVSPAFFYWIEVIDGVKSCLCFVGFGTVILGAAILGLSFIDRDLARYRGKIATIFFVGCIMGLLALFIPSKETIIQMEVARRITPNNLTTIGIKADSLRMTIKKDIIDIVREAARAAEEEKK
jgi:hypothetical protein